MSSWYSTRKVRFSEKLVEHLINNMVKTVSKASGLGKAIFKNKPLFKCHPSFHVYLKDGRRTYICTFLNRRIHFTVAISLKELNYWHSREALHLQIQLYWRSVVVLSTNSSPWNSGRVSILEHTMSSDFFAKLKRHCC